VGLAWHVSPPTWMPSMTGVGEATTMKITAAQGQQQEMSPEAGAPSAIRKTRRPALALGTRMFNPIILRLAGKRHMRAYAVLEHRGRRSGRLFTTPVAARPTSDGFLIPMAFGEQADWFRNVLAAGGCVIRWNGDAYHVAEPELVDWATAQKTLGRFSSMLAPIFSKQFVHLRRVPAPADSAIDQ